MPAVADTFVGADGTSVTLDGNSPGGPWQALNGTVVTDGANGCYNTTLFNGNGCMQSTGQTSGAGGDAQGDIKCYSDVGNAGFGVYNPVTGEIGRAHV